MLPPSRVGTFAVVSAPPVVIYTLGCNVNLVERVSGKRRIAPADQRRAEGSGALNIVESVLARLLALLLMLAALFRGPRALRLSGDVKFKVAKAMKSRSYRQARRVLRRAGFTGVEIHKRGDLVFISCDQGSAVISISAELLRPTANGKVDLVSAGTLRLHKPKIHEAPQPPVKGGKGH